MEDLGRMCLYDRGMFPVRLIAWLGLCLLSMVASAQSSGARWLALHDDARIRESTALAQTADGFLWVGTASGLMRFDGVEWLEAASKDFGKRKVNDLLVDPQDTLWIASNHALWRRDGGRFIELVTIDTPKAEIRRLRWIGTSLYLATDAGIFRYEADRGLVSMPGTESAFDVMADANGVGLLAGAMDGLYAWNESTWQRIAGGNPESLIVSLARDSDDQLWLGGYTLRRLLPDDREGPAEGPAQRIRQILKLSNGDLWVTTNSDGIFLRDGRGHWRQGDRRLRGESVGAIFEDRERNVWVAATGAGLHQFALTSNEVVDFEDGLPTKLLASVASDGKDGVWVATYGSGLVHVDGAGTVRRHATECGDMLTSLVWSAPDTLWLGGEGGLCMLRKGHVERLHDQEPIVTLSAAKDGGLWVLGRTELRHLVDGRTNWRLQNLDVGRQTAESALQDAGDGNVWLTLSDGVAIAGPHGLRKVDEHGQPIAILATESGHLWMLQGENLALLDKHGARHATVAASGAWLLWRDRVGDLWQIGRSGSVRTNEGELRAALQSDRMPPVWEAFDAADGHDGVQPSSVGSPSIAALTDDRVAVVALGQIRIGSLNPLPWSRPSLHAEVTSVSAPGVSEAVQGQQFSPDQRSIQIRYTAASLRNPLAVHFRYRLNPIDADWSEWTADRGVSLARLPANDYSFEVQAQAPGSATAAPARFDFTILPHWHETGWVRALGVLALLLLATATGVLILRWRMHRLTEHRRELQLLVAERTQELDEANRQLAQLARTDPLTGLANLRAFRERCDLEWRRTRREGGSLALLMIDVDYFKAYNDCLGHAAGDVALQRIATALADSVHRPSELVARYGGEEFVALLSHAKPGDALAVAEKMRSRVVGLGIEHPGHRDADGVTVSIGVAVSAQTDESIDSILARADSALYEAKSAGRNRVFAG